MHGSKFPSDSQVHRHDICAIPISLVLTDNKTIVSDTVASAVRDTCTPTRTRISDWDSPVEGKENDQVHKDFANTTESADWLAVASLFRKKAYRVGMLLGVTAGLHLPDLCKPARYGCRP